MASRAPRRWVTSFLYYSAAATGLGGTVLYVSYRPRNIPGSQGAAVPPPIAADGTITPPTFPNIKSRDQQIVDLRRSGGGVAPQPRALESVSLTQQLMNAFDQFRDVSSTTSAPGMRSDVGEPYDLLVIGGGATGSGIALDAATRGLKVALVERDDFAAGTSSKSTKLVHGGVRYLEKAVWELDYNQYALVKEALRERSYFLHTCPQLTSWRKAPSFYWSLTRF